MKRKALKLIVLSLFFSVISCDEPETSVTNFVHPDGSVTRRIEMRSPDNNPETRFKSSDLQVPFDVTWAVTDSCEVNEKGDTTWVRRAVKLFNNTDEINQTYLADSGINNGITRKADFKRKFLWFHTRYTFSERIEKTLSFGYPVTDFLNPEELAYFYSPEIMQADKQNGADSMKYRHLEDTINYKTDKWMEKNLVSEWIGDFSELLNGKGGSKLSLDTLKEREDELLNSVKLFDSKFDSLWESGIILKNWIGDTEAIKYRTEADSAIECVTSKLLKDFSGYSMKVVMPGKLIGTNGFIDSSKVIIWPVKSDYFLTGPYIMQAESKVSNVWAWIISGLFVAFVLTGLLIKIKKKG
jgi:hypothetical protein